MDKGAFFQKTFDFRQAGHAFFQTRRGMVLWGACAFIGLVLLLLWGATVIFYEPRLQDLPHIEAPEGPLRVRVHTADQKSEPLAVYRHLENPKAQQTGVLQKTDNVSSTSYRRSAARAAQPKSSLKNPAQARKAKQPPAKVFVKAKKLNHVVWKGEARHKADKERIASVENLLERMESST